MKLTTHQIIDQTVAWYQTHPRSMGHTQYGNITCRYFGDKGTHCAFSRCCRLDDPAVSKVLKEMDDSGSGGSLSDFYNEEKFEEAIGEPFQLMLQEQYRGHSIDFWSHLQSLHDLELNWVETTTGNNLTEIGKERVEKLKKQFPEEQVA